MNQSILIDAGNSRVKWRLGDGGVTAFNWSARTSLDVESLFPQVTAGTALVASVRAAADNLILESGLQSRGYDSHFAQVEPQCLGLVCGYPEPAQLGVDRWLGMLAVWAGRERGFLLVSAGTALTLDLVDSSGKHLGGYITPGLTLQRQSLTGQSAKLDAQWAESGVATSPGKNTAEAINNGVIAATVAHIHAQIISSGQDESDLVISGGDAEALAPFFPGAELNRSAVLDGLALWGRENNLAL